MSKAKHQEQIIIKAFLDKKKPILIDYVKGRDEELGLTPEIKAFLLNDIESIFNFLYSEI